MNIYDQAAEAALYIESQISSRPKTAIALGTGLSEVSARMDIEKEISYSDIPHLQSATVEGHAGKLIIGRWAGRAVVILSGRLHYYEGYDMDEVTFPIRVLGLLGVDHFILTNVAGGLNPAYQAGDIVLVTDHIYMIPENPLRGEHDERFGPRFPDMSDVYDVAYIEKALAYGQNNNLPLHTGVYYCLQGPNLETRAEYQMIHRVGGDLVGMSTIPEVIVAKHQGASVNVISIVSNVCYPPDQVTKTTIDEVIKVANQATPGLIQVIEEMVNMESNF